MHTVYFTIFINVSEHQRIKAIKGKEEETHKSRISSKAIAHNIFFVLVIQTAVGVEPRGKTIFSIVGDSGDSMDDSMDDIGRVSKCSGHLHGPANN